jgi:hypothetical protein
LPLNELKRTVELVLGTAFTAKATLSYPQFERFLFEVASLAFKEAVSGEVRFRMLVQVVKPFVETAYGVVLSPERSAKTRREGARPPVLQQKEREQKTMRGKQIDMNISAALQVLKTGPLIGESKVNSLSPSRNKTPDMTPDRLSSQRGSETDRFHSPSRIVRTAKRTLSSTSISEFAFKPARSMSFVGLDDFARDRPITVRLKNKNTSVLIAKPCISESFKSDTSPYLLSSSTLTDTEFKRLPLTLPRSESKVMDRYREFVGRRHSSCFSSVRAT